MQLLKTLVNRKWWWVTLLVLLAMGVMARLGTWQLDRRDQKRAANIALAQRWLDAPFDLNQDALPTDLVELEYRQVQATGQYDYSQQISLKNFVKNEIPGSILITPLLLADGRAVLVARGFVPYDQSAPAQWAQFDEAPGETVTLRGTVDESHPLPAETKITGPQQEWFSVDIAAIQKQMSYQLLPVTLVLLQEPTRSLDQLPIRAEEPAPLDEFMHVSYAIQWFMFAVIAGFMYVQLVIQQERRAKRLRAEALATTDAAHQEP